MQNWTHLLPASKNSEKWLNNFFDLLALEKCTSYVVWNLRVDKVIITKFWKLTRNVDALVLRKFKKPILCFEIEISSFCSLFFLCFFHVHYFLFTLLTIIGATKQKSAHINNVPDINKITTITSWRNQDMTPYSNFRKIIELVVI